MAASAAYVPQLKAPQQRKAAICHWCTEPPRCCVCHDAIVRGALFWHIEKIAEGGTAHAHKSCARRHM